MSQREVELITGAGREMTAASSPFLSLDFSVEQAMTLLGILQLSLRHPGIASSVQEAARQTAEDLECQLSSLGPNVRELCRMGWQTAADNDAA